MTMVIRSAFLLSFFAFISKPILADCTPDTVQFYLDKGFNQAQITQLCSSSSSEAPVYQPYQKPTIIYQEGGSHGGSSAEENKAISQIKGGLAARSIEVTPERINYIRQVCIKGGQGPEAQQRTQRCIDVAYSIAREGLLVEQAGQKFLVLGEKEIGVVSSDIKRKYVVDDPWGGLSPELKFQLKRKYESKESGNQTNIPVSKNASFSELNNAFKVIAAATVTRKTGNNTSEVGRVLDDSYVPPSAEEYEASRPKPVESAENTKKGKWWNPFD